MTPDLGIEPGPHGWEASALTTAPSLARLCFSLAVGHDNVRGQLKKKRETPIATNVSTSLTMLFKASYSDIPRVNRF